MKYVGKILYVTFAEMVACGVYPQTIKNAKQRGSKCWEFIKDPQDKRRLLIRYDVLAERYKNALALNNVIVPVSAINN